MKSIFIISFIVSSFIGCRDENDPKPKVEIPLELIGTWKVFEVYSTDGSSIPTWTNIPEQLIFYYSFHIDFTVRKDPSGEGCNKGTFSIDEGNMISFKFPCISYTSEIDSLTNETLILDTQNFEPLKYKFRKIVE